MQFPMIWVRAGCLLGAAALIAVVEGFRSRAAWDASAPWSFTTIAVATAVAAALGRTIYALILRYNRLRR